MITSDAFAGRRYGVYGLARSGRAVVASLVASGASVWAWDDRGEAREGVEAEIIDLMSADLAGLDGIVVSPGVPLNTHPLAARAEAANVPVIGDIELFALAREGLPEHRVVGITGTNGKSTTAALVHHVLASAGVPARLGGNIGVPILSTEPLPDGGVYVLELSSFQIDLTRSLDCDVAVLLNVSADHLDRYEDIDAYAASKARLFEMQSPDGAMVIAADDGFTLKIAAELRRHGRREDKLSLVHAESVRDQSRWPTLQGPHNAQNVAAATAVCERLGLTAEQIEAGLASYPGLPHRMERVREKGGVLFVNDSKATNPTSAAPALAAYPAVRWIAGGQAKTAELDACEPWLGHVRGAYLIGEAAELFGRLLAGKTEVVQAGTLEEAVRRAAADAGPGETVLLSPACASFDQFRDYAHRGDVFRAAVEAL